MRASRDNMWHLSRLAENVVRPTYDRHRARRESVRHSMRDLVHRGNGRPSGHRHNIEGRGREDGCGDRWLSRLLHDQLCASGAFRARARGGRALAVADPCVKANASTKSHAELDESETLDAGDPVDLGRRYRDLRQSFPTMRILGGCCGTDHRHVAAICDACLPPRAHSA